MSNSEQHRQIVKKLLDSKTVDFTALGKIISEIGPTLALSDEDGPDICGTMRGFIRILRVATPAVPLENLGELGANARELKG
jgi:hypothetical protein